MSEKISYSKKYGAICILDALGTKGIWKQKNPEDVINRWEGLINAMDDYIKTMKNEVKFNLYAFSDTLIITSSGNVPIEKILYELSILTTVSVNFGLPYGIFLRGCIGLGNFYESEKMILGPAIDEVVQYYESANWIGVHLTPSAYSAVDRLISVSENKLENRFALYPVPLKNGKLLNTYVLANADFDLKSIVDESIGDENPLLLEEERTLLDFIHYRLEHLSDVEGSDKWKNTLECVKFMTKKFVNKSNPPK